MQFTWDNRVPTLELASQHCTKQLQVTFVPVSSWLQGIRELKPLFFLSICNTWLRTIPKLEEGWAKLSSSCGEHITFPIAMWSLEKYIDLDNIITKEESFSILTYTFSISSSLIYCLESSHLLISMKSNLHLGACKDTLGTNDANGQKDLYPRREMLVEPYCQL